MVTKHIDEAWLSYVWASNKGIFCLCIFWTLWQRRWGYSEFWILDNHILISMLYNSFSCKVTKKLIPMNGQLIVFSYFCRKYAALGKVEASFLCSRLRYFCRKYAALGKVRASFLSYCWCVCRKLMCKWNKSTGDLLAVVRWQKRSLDLRSMKWWVHMSSLCLAVAS